MISPAGTLSATWSTAIHWTLGALLVAVILVHFRNRGRSGPVAALMFVLFGPVFGVVLVLGWLIGADPRNPAAREQLYGLHLSQFLEVAVIFGLAAALLGMLFHGYRIRDELRAYREFAPPTWLGSLRTGQGPSPALAALGIAPDATLEDVEKAYREQAKQAHPDRGGSVEQFKRLQIIYEQAKRQVLRRKTPPGPASAPSTATDA